MIETVFSEPFSDTVSHIINTFNQIFARITLHNTQPLVLHRNLIFL